MGRSNLKKLGVAVCSSGWGAEGSTVEATFRATRATRVSHKYRRARRKEKEVLGKGG